MTADRANAEEHALAAAMAQARPDDGLDEATALAKLKRGLFAEAAPAPVMLSRYVLLERIGVGGLGVVYAAYDPSLDRRVAIKLLQDRALADEDEQQARERLAREAQAIAKLAHPNVVAVHDVGTYALSQPLEGAQPRGVFVVMEFVDGLDAEAWVHAAVRSWREVLELYLAAGRGLEAAHRAGLVHRDFKPGNVMVGRDGRVRVLDFGLARSHGGSTPSQEGVTVTPRRDVTSEDRDGAATDLRAGKLDSPITIAGRIVGTPAYMAPEQHDGAAADVRSDQFACCVALWEGLFGTRPFPSNRVAALAEAKQAGRWVSPPPSKVPRAFVRILARGLAADPAARWPDMGSLLAALAIVPRRRRQLAFGGLALATFAAVAGLAGQRGASPRTLCGDFDTVAAEQWHDGLAREIVEVFAASGRPHAEASANAVVAGLDAYAREWTRRRRESCESTFVRHEQSPEAMNRTALCLDAHLERAAELVAVLRVADGDTVDHAVDAVDALPPWRECDSAAAEPVGESSAAEREIERMLGRAETLLEAAHPEDARGLAEDARTQAERAGLTLWRGRAELLLGRLHQRAGRPEASITALYAAQAAAERSGDERTATAALLGLCGAALDAADLPQAQRMLAVAEGKLSRHELGSALKFEALFLRARESRVRGDLPAAEQATQQAVALAQREFPVGHLAIARGQAMLGVIYGDLGDTTRATEAAEAALQAYRARLGPDHPYIADQLESLASIDMQHGRYDAALAGYERAQALRERVWGHRHPQVAYAIANVASALQSLGRTQESLARSREALEILVAARGEAHPEVAIAASNLANVLLDVDPEQARAMAVRAQQAFRDSVGTDHPNYGYALAAEGLALTALTRFDEAAARLTEARRRLLDGGGPDAPALAVLDKALAEAELGAGRLAIARTYVQRSIEALSRGAHDPRDLAGAELLRAILDRDDAPQTLASLRESWLRAGRPAAEFDTLRAGLLAQRDRADAAAKRR
ncbi:MAG: serine/threonine-protein kinase [Nannocystaceae bacterium]